VGGCREERRDADSCAPRARVDRTKLRTTSRWCHDLLLRGRVLHLDAESAIVEVGGVGFSVAVPASVARSLHVGDETTAHRAHRAGGRPVAVRLRRPRRARPCSITCSACRASVPSPPSACCRRSASIRSPRRRRRGRRPVPARLRDRPKTAKLIVVQLAGKLHVTSATSRRLPAPPPATSPARSSPRSRPSGGTSARASRR
jgi:Holliday junction DNA helicase RuvA